MDNFFDNYLDRLINSSNNASARSRTTYFILSLSCIFIIIGVFNMEMSWERHLNFKERLTLGFDQNLYPQNSNVLLVLKNKLSYDSLDKSSQIIYEKYIDNMSQNYTNELFKRFELQIPVLGTRIFSSDLSLLASLGIVVLFTWLYFSIRREYHIVKKIKEEFDKTNSFNIRKHLFYGTVYENVFTTATKDHVKFTAVTMPNFVSKVLRLFIKYISPRTVMAILRFLPTITIFFTIFSDLRYLPDTIFGEYSTEIVFRLLIAMINMLYTFIIALQIVSYDKGIERIFNYMKHETTFET
jgi:hypothetical protein